jgi:lipid II:glycine glycyltransferase (peptidoglycan interpeptide bridge formation enzyme)
VVALPFSDFCPPLAADDVALGELLAGLQAQRRQRGWPAVRVHWSLPDRPGVYVGETVARHVTCLATDPEEVRRRFRGSVVRLVRQAERAEIAVARGESWEDARAFYRLHQETRHRLGTPVQPLRFFRLLWERALSQGLGFVLLARKDGRPVAGAVFLHWNGTLVYKYGASLPAYWQLRPNNLLFWEAIRWGCERGYRVFDWGKTDLEDEGLRNFKRGWGSEERLVRYSVLADAPPAPPATAGYRRRLLTSLIQRSPVWVGRAVGEVLYGHFA